MKMHGHISSETQSLAAARPSSDGGWRVVFPPAVGTHNPRSRETTRVTPFAHLHIGSFANYSLFTIHYSLGLSVDPMSDKYPSLSPYTYCANNPVKLVDPNGEEVINGYAEELSAAKDCVNELTDELSGLTKRTEEYRRTKCELKEAQRRLGRIQDKYDIVEDAINDFKTRCPDEFEELDNLQSPTGFTVDIVVTLKYNLNDNLKKGQSIIEWSSSIWKFPTYDFIFYWFEPIEVYLNPKACFGREDIGATLAHEGGHAFYEVTNPAKYKQWQMDNGHLNEDGYNGHDGGSLSGNKAYEWEKKFKETKNE